jgi:hypothetical protein
MSMEEVERRDPIKMSEGYSKTADEALAKGHILDGLVNLHLAEDHLVGWTAPVHNRVNRKIYPVDERVILLKERQAEARARLRSEGPIVSADADSADS